VCEISHLISYETRNSTHEITWCVPMFTHMLYRVTQKNRTHKSSNDIFSNNHSSFLYVLVVDLEHEILQHQFFPPCRGQPKRRHFVWRPFSLSIHTKCKQVFGESFSVIMLHQRAENLTGFRSLQSMFERSEGYLFWSDSVGRAIIAALNTPQLGGSMLSQGAKIQSRRHLSV